MNHVVKLWTPLCISWHWKGCPRFALLLRSHNQGILASASLLLSPFFRPYLVPFPPPFPTNKHNGLYPYLQKMHTINIIYNTHRLFDNMDIISIVNHLFIESGEHKIGFTEWFLFQILLPTSETSSTWINISRKLLNGWNKIIAKSSYCMLVT
jgi:hypothetical protein